MQALQPTSSVGRAQASEMGAQPWYSRLDMNDDQSTRQEPGTADSLRIFTTDLNAPTAASHRPCKRMHRIRLAHRVRTDEGDLGCRGDHEVNVAAPSVDRPGVGQGPSRSRASRSTAAAPMAGSPGGGAAGACLVSTTVTGRTCSLLFAHCSLLVEPRLPFPPPVPSRRRGGDRGAIDDLLARGWLSVQARRR